MRGQRITVALQVVRFSDRLGQEIEVAKIFTRDRIDPLEIESAILVGDPIAQADGGGEALAVSVRLLRNASTVAGRSSRTRATRESTSAIVRAVTSRLMSVSPRAALPMAATPSARDHAASS